MAISVCDKCGGNICSDGCVDRDEDGCTCGEFASKDGIEE